jgi:hypothetical protein
MDMGLASDLGNRNFVGAVNPDSLLSVEFYWHEPEDPNKSMEAGKLIRGPKIPYVRIQNPGDKTSIIETAVTDHHKHRWPDHWLRWQVQEGMINNGADVPGWKLEEWTHLNPEQVRELRYLRFSVVEQVAGASDDQIQRIGMGGLALREEARRALKARLGAEIKDELSKKDAQIAALKAADAEKEARLARLEALLTAPKADPVPAPAPVAATPVEAKDTSERDALVEKYVAKFGKKPHHKSGVEKIRKELGE